jgi:hypothetical protein
LENSNQIVYSNVGYHQPLYQCSGLSNYLPLAEWDALKFPNSIYVYRVPSDLAVINLEISFIRNTANFYILFDDCLEGYTVHGFERIHGFITDNGLRGKFIFLSGNRDVNEEYSAWRKKNSLDKAFEVFYNSNWYYRIKQNVVDFKLKKRPIDKTEWFMCLNNRLHPHRAMAVTYMDHLGLLEKGKVTCLDKDYGENAYVCNFEDRMFSFSAQFDKQHVDILRHQASITSKKLPLSLDTEDFALGSRPHDYNPEFYNKTLINVVTETYYQKDFGQQGMMFFSEKIWKSIALKQIFILIGPQYGLKYLKELGFSTYGDFVDESYDELDDGQRLFAAIDALNKTMKTYTVDELNKATRQRRQHNFKHFMSQIPQRTLCKDITQLLRT